MVHIAKETAGLMWPPCTWYWMLLSMFIKKNIIWKFTSEHPPVLWRILFCRFKRVQSNYLLRLVANLCFPRTFGSTEILGFHSFPGVGAVTAVTHSPPQKSKVAVNLVRCSLLTANQPPSSKVVLQLVSCSFLTTVTPPPLPTHSTQYPTDPKNLLIVNTTSGQPMLHTEISPLAVFATAAELLILGIRGGVGGGDCSCASVSWLQLCFRILTADTPLPHPLKSEVVSKVAHFQFLDFSDFYL